MTGTVGNTAAAPITGAQPNTAAPAATAPANGARTLAANDAATLLNQVLGAGLQFTPRSLGDNNRSLTHAINDMANLSDLRQKRLRDILSAIAIDAQASGQYNQVALQRLNRETTLEEQSNQLMRNVFDKLNNATSAWVQR